MEKIHVESLIHDESETEVFVYEGKNGKCVINIMTLLEKEVRVLLNGKILHKEEE